jgi:hypothetical protein
VIAAARSNNLQWKTSAMLPLVVHVVPLQTLIAEEMRWNDANIQHQRSFPFID